MEFERNRLRRSWCWPLERGSRKAQSPEGMNGQSPSKPRFGVAAIGGVGPRAEAGCPTVASLAQFVSVNFVNGWRNLS
jgi:hypothetical protein